MELYASLAQHAQRFHAIAGDSHHVGSPLGSWLLLALCAPASSGATRDELASVLGADVETAAATAAALLNTPHPLIASAAAVWHRLAGGAGGGAGDSGWLAGLPAAVATGELPSQGQLDAWAREHTFGLIERFPLQVTPETLLVLASALATRVSWDQPFDLAPARELGAHSPWAERLSTVLRTPQGRGHDQYIATTDRAGDVAVHTAQARDGLSVTSVIADAGVPAADVLVAAYQVVSGDQRRRSLFELPLGEGPLWTLTEQAVQTKAADGREEHCMAVLPAWSAQSEHDLGHPDLGFAAAARALAEEFGLSEFRYTAKQSAVARYSRYGFEAAAVTGMAMLTSMPVLRDGVRRSAELRFGHPYAVVAVATQQHGPWHGVPVFSAWVAQPQDADEPQ